MENQTNHIWENKWFIPIIVGIFVILILFVVLMGIADKKASVIQISNTVAQPTPTPFVINQTSLSMDLASSNSAAIKIDTGVNSVVGVQISMAYPANSFSNFDILPGEFLQAPLVYSKKIDAINGTLLYVLMRPPGAKGIKGKGTLATIVFTKSNPFSKATIDFTPSTFVSAEGISSSVLKQASGLPAVKK